jgi:hypothetical protein
LKLTQIITFRLFPLRRFCGFRATNPFEIISSFSCPGPTPPNSKVWPTGLAEPLGIPQGGVSRLERRTGMYVSTLRNYIRAMGGELKITVVFPNGVVEISQFQDVEEQKKS